MNNWNLWPDNMQADITHLTILQALVLVVILSALGIIGSRH